LIAAVGVEASRDGSSVIEDDSGNNCRAVGGGVGDSHEDSVDSFDDFIDGAGDTGIVNKDVGEPALVASRGIQGAARAIMNFL